VKVLNSPVNNAQGAAAAAVKEQAEERDAFALDEEEVLVFSLTAVTSIDTFLFLVYRQRASSQPSRSGLDVAMNCGEKCVTFLLK